MTRRFLLATSILLLPLVWGLTPNATAQQAPQLTIAQLQAVFPGSGKLTEADRGRFKSVHVDLNGDGKKEYVIIDNPNAKKAAPKAPAAAPNQCLCPAPKPAKKEKRAAGYLKAHKASIHQIEFVKERRRRYALKVWFSLRKAKGKSFHEWAQAACVTLGKKYSRVRKWKVRDVYFVNTDDGQTTKIRASRCRSLSRTKKRRRAKRFKRWRSDKPNAMVPKCPCPKKKKKKKKKKLPPIAKALNVVVAYMTQPASAAVPAAPAKGKEPVAISAAALLPQLKVIGRLRGVSIRPVMLNNTGKMYGLRIEQVIDNGPRKPRITTERIYIYDQGNTGRLKQVFQLKTAREGDDKEPGAKQWVDLKFRQMDSDAWLEITADAYYETPRFNGLVARRMYKWYQGRYVPLNTYRGILSAKASSTWTRLAPRGTRMLQKRLSLRTNPANVVDGFRDTPWVANKRKRSIGDWVRVDMMRTVQMIGVALAVQTPTSTYNYYVPRLFSSRPPKLVSPQYVLIKTSSGFKQTAMVKPNGFTFIRFPTTVQTRYIHVTISGTHRAGKRVMKVALPAKENAIGLISEIIPITNQIRYTASSFELKSTTPMTPSLAGDNRTASAWGEGRKDSGIGEWLQMVFPTPRTLNTITVVNGCHRPGERYIMNNRVKDAKLTFSDGTSVNITLKDNHKPQKIKVGGKRTMSLMLTISSIYKGKLGHTTCLAEMRP